MIKEKLPTVYQEFLALSRYARYDNENKRREYWGETVSRYANFCRDILVSSKCPKDLVEKTINEIEDSISGLDIMPSMRALMTAGPAAIRSPAAAYNCSYSTISGTGPTVELWDEKLGDMGYDEPIKIKLHNPIVFDEAFFILLNGTGFGFSVERQFIANLPTVGKALSRSVYKKTAANFPRVPKEDLSSYDKRSNTIIVADSKEGWASALRIFIVEMYNGNFTVKIDISGVRPAGSVLKTFGGRASGPEVLVEMLEGLRGIFSKADGRKLTSIECHDILCFISSAVVVGGVRRAALISLSNLSDERMRYAKSGEWWIENPQRRLANNSAAHTEKPEVGTFMREWISLYESKSGERGIFNRKAAIENAARYGRILENDVGLNPCGEIFLRPNQFCNLTAAAARPDDTLESLKEKVRIATIVGTIQATLTNFSYISSSWKENCEEERLLGVSIPGAMDHPVLQNVSEEAESWIDDLSQVVIDTNCEWSKLLEINPAAASRCQKPAGNSGELYNVASGLHARFSPYYIRRVRADAKDPLAQVMKNQGFPCEEDTMQPGSWVFSFPVKTPEGAVFRDDRTAIEQLEYWLMWKKHWTDHNPSVTIYVKEHEWMEVGAWVWNHFDEVCGISFLPHSDHVYKQAPYEEITREEYEKMLEEVPTYIDYEALKELETSDQTISMQELACSAGGCDLI